jgi:uncharacterized protein DUF3168
VIPIYAAVRAVVAGEPAVLNLAAERVYADVLPQNPTLPAVVLQAWFIRDAPTTTGASGFEAHRLQVDAYATTRAVADQVMDAVANALDPRAPNNVGHLSEGVRLAIRQDTGSGRPTYDGLDTKLYRRSMDFKVQAARAA